MTKNSKKKLYIRRTVSVLAVLAMLFSLSACVFPTAEEDLPEETASSAESVEEPASDAEVETSNGSYEISAQYNLDLNELEQWYTTENGNFVPNQWDIDNLKSIAKENPEYEEHINFFIEHIGSYNQTAVNKCFGRTGKSGFCPDRSLCPKRPRREIGILSYRRESPVLSSVRYPLGIP